MSIFSSRQPHRIGGIFCCWCLVSCVLAGYSQEAWATCGDYVIVGNPRMHSLAGAMPGSHGSSKTSDEKTGTHGMSEAPSNSAPFPCHGSECKSAPHQHASSVAPKLTLQDFAQAVRTQGHLSSIPSDRRTRIADDSVPVGPFLEAPVPPPRYVL